MIETLLRTMWKDFSTAPNRSLAHQVAMSDAQNMSQSNNIYPIPIYGLITRDLHHQFVMKWVAQSILSSNITCINQSFFHGSNGLEKRKRIQLHPRKQNIPKESGQFKRKGLSSNQNFSGDSVCVYIYSAFL